MDPFYASEASLHDLLDETKYEVDINMVKTITHPNMSLMIPFVRSLFQDRVLVHVRYRRAFSKLPCIVPLLPPLWGIVMTYCFGSHADFSTDISNVCVIQSTPKPVLGYTTNNMYAAMRKAFTQTFRSFGSTWNGSVREYYEPPFFLHGAGIDNHDIAACSRAVVSVMSLDEDDGYGMIQRRGASELLRIRLDRETTVLCVVIPTSIDSRLDFVSSMSKDYDVFGTAVCRMTKDGLVVHVPLNETSPPPLPDEEDVSMTSIERSLNETSSLPNNKE